MAWHQIFHIYSFKTNFLGQGYILWYVRSFYIFSTFNLPLFHFWVILWLKGSDTIFYFLLLLLTPVLIFLIGLYIPNFILHFSEITFPFPSILVNVWKNLSHIGRLSLQNMLPQCNLCDNAPGEEGIYTTEWSMAGMPLCVLWKGVSIHRALIKIGKPES